jgi:hypothetical protein
VAADCPQRPDGARPRNCAIDNRMWSQLGDACLVKLRPVVVRMRWSGWGGARSGARIAIGVIGRGALRAQSHPAASRRAPERFQSFDGFQGSGTYIEEGVPAQSGPDGAMA